MKALVVYCHPKEGSFTSAIRDLVLAKLTEKGADVRVVDLYGNGFSPVLSGAELDCYEDAAENTKARAGGRKAGRSSPVPSGKPRPGRSSTRSAPAWHRIFWSEMMKSTRSCTVYSAWSPWGLPAAARPNASVCNYLLCPQAPRAPIWR